MLPRLAPGLCVAAPVAEKPFAATTHSSVKWAASLVFNSVVARHPSLTDIGLFAIGDGGRTTTHVQYVGYRVGMVPRDETLLTHRLVASPSIQIGGKGG